MAESIEYSSIVKFINDDIIQEKLAHLVKHIGGMNSRNMLRMSPEVANPYPQNKKVERVTSPSASASAPPKDLKVAGIDFAKAAQVAQVPNAPESKSQILSEISSRNSSDLLKTLNDGLSEKVKLLAGPWSSAVEIVLKSIMTGGSSNPKRSSSSTFSGDSAQDPSSKFLERSVQSPYVKTATVTFGLAIGALLYSNSEETQFLALASFGALVLAVANAEEITVEVAINKVKEVAGSIVTKVKEALGFKKDDATPISSSLSSNTSDKDENKDENKDINLGGGAFIVDPILGFLKLLWGLVTMPFTAIYNLFVGSSSASKSVSFAFDSTKGDIVVIGKMKRTAVKLNSSSHFGITGIEMVVDGDKVTYTVNGTPLDAHSYIEGKPVHTALVMAYLVKDKHFNKFAPHSTAAKSDAAFLYSIEDDGSVRLFKKDPNGARGEEIASINTAIRKQLEGDEKGAIADRTKVCKDLFNVKPDNKTCADHFYNILGKSAMGMLQNMGAAAKTDSVSQALLNAEPHIKYEILKNLDWKMKVSNGKKEMATPDQWLERLEQDTRPAIKSLAAQYKKYFDDNVHVKTILEKMVMDLNNNTRLLDEKYKEAVQAPQPAVRRRKARLSAAQVASLRSQVLTENVALNSPMPVPGYPGFNLIELRPNQLHGGSSGSYEQHFENIKQSLAGFNQKLSSDTDRKIKSKISEINELTSRLDTIHKNITEYTKILRTEKYPTGISRTVTLSDVENLINQYKAGTQEQTKQIVTLSTAFGKIKMLLEKQEVNSAKPAEKNFMFDL